MSTGSFAVLVADSSIYKQTQ